MVERKGKKGDTVPLCPDRGEVSDKHGLRHGGGQETVPYKGITMEQEREKKGKALR